MDEVETLVTSYYTLDRVLLPPLTSTRFAYFAGEVHQLIRQVMTGKTSKYNLSFHDFGMAAWEESTRTIYLPYAYLSLDFYRKIMRDQEIDAASAAAYSIACCNGSAIHEALHGVLSSYSLLEEHLHSESGRWKTMMARYGAPAIRAFCNVIEDLYIETWLELSSSEKEQLPLFVALKNMVFFNPAAVNELLEATGKAFEESPHIRAFTGLDLAATFKNKRAREIPKLRFLLGGKACSILDTFKEPREAITFLDRHERRFEMALDLLECFSEPTPEEKADAEHARASRMLSGFTGHGRGRSRDRSEREAEAAWISILKAEGDKARAKRRPHEDSESYGDDLESAWESEASFIERLAMWIVVASDYDETLVREMMPSEFNPEKLKYADVIELRQLGLSSVRQHSLPSGKPDLSFVKQIVSLRTPANTYGSPLTKGNKIVANRLWRMSTDSKIFTFQEAEVDKYKKTEVIILVDSSGSMGSTRYSYTGSSLYDNCMAYGVWIHETLLSCGVDAILTGFTSEYERSDDVPRTFVIARDKPASRGIIQQLERVNLKENYDGVSIYAVRKLFTNRKSKKIIIVLSDGTPCAPGYSGSKGVEHTRQVVNRARKDGIGVFCISLVKSVEEANSHIYGDRFNVRAGTRDIKQEFEKLVTSLIPTLR